MDRFAALSASERRLSIIVAALLCAAAIMAVCLRCKDALDSLDDRISGQQLQLMDLSRYAALAGPVDEAYAAVAKQHSSEWTQEQIHDRLRVEIARLSLRRVPAEGTPIPAVSKPGDLLVDIRQWPVGALEDSGEGYRTYQINFRTEPTAIQNIAMFLERLQQSPQALRVDRLDLSRQPASTAVTATFYVTRTVIGNEPARQPKTAASNSPAPAGNLIANPDFAQWDAQESTANGWIATNAALSTESDITPGGDTALVVRARTANAQLYQDLQLRIGATYDLYFAARVTGAAEVRVLDESGENSIHGEAPLKSGNMAYRYHYRFTVPGTGASLVTMRAPVFIIPDTGGTVTVDNVRLVEAGT